jgi:PIN domain nuclease of toxin-antitoxin system
VTAYLVDTHVLLWWLSGDRRLPARSRAALVEPAHQILVSAVSAWEVSIKSGLGKLVAPGDLIDAVERSGLEWVPIDPREAYRAGGLPLHHRDPFDRLLVAQALERALPVISHDAAFDAYGVTRVWN